VRSDFTNRTSGLLSIGNIWGWLVTLDFIVILTRLQLQNFRNYRKLDLELQPGNTLLFGSNGAGKTNIVEAIFTLATTKSFRARTDGELIDRDFDMSLSPYPFARLQGDTDASSGSIRVEILVAGPVAAGGGAVRKQFRLNGAPKRASDVVGQIKAVLFSPADVEIVTGSPSARRRYIDLMLCQVDPSYLRLLQSYQRIVQQRNGVLTRIGGATRGAVLAVWDEKLVAEGSELIVRRQLMMGRLAELAREMYGDLSKRAEELRVEYAPSVSVGAGGDPDDRPALVRAVAEAFERDLATESRRVAELRITPVGPHRDDLTLAIDGEPLIAFGSRGQQRTAALAMRMAEARYIHDQTGRQPVLLLDEAIGELDDDRRQALLGFIRPYPQVVLTGTSAEAYPAEFREHAALLEVRDGRVAGATTA
jgi:DNA replication and repair protein RecF